MKQLISIVVILLFVFSFKSGLANPSNGLVVILYTSKNPVFPKVPDGCCKYYDIDKFKDPKIKANTVILSGHGEPPVYAGHSASQVAEIISSFKPELIVLNTCYGASYPILEALSEKNNGKMVVAPPYEIYLPGYTFWNGFFNSNLSIEERAKNVVTEPYYPQLKWRINKYELKKVKDKVLKMSKIELRKNYLRRVPPLIKVKINESFNKDNEILVLLTKKEIQSIK